MSFISHLFLLLREKGKERKLVGKILGTKKGNKRNKNFLEDIKFLFYLIIYENFAEKSEIYFIVFPFYKMFCYSIVYKDIKKT